jgi:hypothetical protein
VGAIRRLNGVPIEAITGAGRMWACAIPGRSFDQIHENER